VALVDADTGEERRFSDLDRESDVIASNLASLGVGKGSRVATLMSKTLRHVEVFFAARKLGASLVPLNFALKRESIQSQIGRTSPKVVVDDMFDLGIRSETLLKEGSGGGSRPVQVVRGSAEDETFVLFTGGSTGLPKGAVVHEGSVVWNAVNTVLSWGFTQEDVAYVPFPLYHIGGWNIFLIPLFFVGGKTVVASKFEEGTSIRALEDFRVTRFVGVPTMLYRLVSNPEFDRHDLSSVIFGCGGGALGKDVAARFISKKYRIFQGYGATETGPNNFYISPERYREKVGSVGKPMLFVEAKLSGEGELLLRGPHVFKGYLPGEEASATAFDRDGFFRTGDLFTVDSEGDFTFAGRKKDMIKTGGENVYSVEVEGAINGLPYVADSAVVGVPHKEWGEMVVAFVVLREGRTGITQETVREDLKRVLPSFKVPKGVVFVRSIPKSEIGKVQKQVLKENYEKGLH
jgi:fatty-acyl-CoA synthase